MKFWYKKKLSFRSFLLWPFSALYRSRAQKKYNRDLELSFSCPLAQKLNTTVLVVGNVTVGGTGKTPMVRFLIRYFVTMGFKVGVISRGYGGNYKGCKVVTPEDPASLVGDEVAMMMAYCQRHNLEGVNFVVCRERIKAALKAQELGCDFIIADDGLQHYRLPRHLEIGIIGPQGLGNGMFIPAGPLRESPKRLKQCEFIINNSNDESLGGYPMQQRNFAFVPLELIKEQKAEISFTQMVEDFKASLANNPEALARLEAKIASGELDLAKLEAEFSSYFLNKAVEEACEEERIRLAQEKSTLQGVADASKADANSAEEGNAPVFKNAEEFLNFINQQLNPDDLSLDIFLAKARARYYQGYVLPELLKAAFPKCLALCGIGYPQGFRKSLEDLGFEVVLLKAFSDHHKFKQKDLDKLYRKHESYKDLPLFVTEKDAIKLLDLDCPAHTYFLERESYFTKHKRWLESFKNKVISYYINRRG